MRLLRFVLALLIGVAGVESVVFAGSWVYDQAVTRSIDLHRRTWAEADEAMRRRLKVVRSCKDDLSVQYFAWTDDSGNLYYGPAAPSAALLDRADLDQVCPLVKMRHGDPA